MIHIIKRPMGVGHTPMGRSDEDGVTDETLIRLQLKLGHYGNQG